MAPRSSCSRSDMGPPFLSSGSAVSELPPPRSTEVKRVCFFGICVAIFGCMLLQAGSAMLAAGVQGAWAQLIGLTFLALLLGFATFLSVYLTHGSYFIRFTAHQESDYVLLLLGIITPSILLMARYNPLPTSDDTKANCLITFAFLLRLGALMDIPPAHSMIQFISSYPILTFLDYNRRCHQPLRYPDTCAFYPSCQLDAATTIGSAVSCGDCCSIASFLHHICSRGLFMLVVGAVSLSVPVIIGIKKGWEARGPLFTPAVTDARCTPDPAPAAQLRKSSVSGSGYETMQPPPAPQISDPMVDVPLEALGIPLVSVWGMVPLLQHMEERLEDIARNVDESVLVSLVCIPIGLYYMGFSLLSRVMPKSFSSELVTSDEWLLAMSVFFVLGRESCSLDMLPYMQLIQSKLQVSQSILRDVLPDHVVNLLVNAEDDFEPERNSLASPMTPPLGDDGEGGTVAEDDAFDDVNSMGVNVGGDRERERESGGGAGPGTGGGLGHRSSMDRLSWGSSGRSAPSVRSSVAFAGSASSAGQSPLPMRTASASPSGVPAAQGQHSALRTLKLAENHDCVTVFLSDICGFSSWAHELPPEQVMSTLNTLYSRLDDIILHEYPSLYKVETIGDAYVVAGNLVCHDRNHAATILRFALRAQQEAARVPRPDVKDGTPVQLRIGIHSGPAVSGIVGKLRRRFCMFGETVDLAMRTESACPPGCIQLTDATHRLVSPSMANEIVFRDRGDIDVVGLSKKIHMYLAVSKDLLVRTRMLTAAGIEL